LTCDEPSQVPAVYVMRTFWKVTLVSCTLLILPLLSVVTVSGSAIQSCPTMGVEPEMKSVDLRVCPIHHWTAERVRAHFLLCMLAYSVEWHLREAWRPFLFDDEALGEHQDGSSVRPALTSPAALEKAQTRQTPDGWPVHSKTASQLQRPAPRVGTSA
jgi:hypothetical protein